MKALQIKLARAAEGGISVKSWISDPANPSDGFEGMELFHAKDDPSLVAYLKQLRQEGYEVTVVAKETLEPDPSGKLQIFRNEVRGFQGPESFLHHPSDEWRSRR